MKYLIYMTTNNIDGKKYIGKHQTEYLDDGYLGSGILLTRAIKKHGVSAFTRKILYLSENDDSLCEQEKKFIAEYDAVASPDFYNISLGGEGGDTYSGAPESDQIRRAALASFHNKGRPKSEETKAKISAAKIGSKSSDETKRRISETMKQRVRDGLTVVPIGNRGNKDFRHKETTKQDLSRRMKEKLSKLTTDYVSEEGKTLAKLKRSEYWTEEKRNERSAKMREYYSTTGRIPWKWIHNPKTHERRQISVTEEIPLNWIRGKGKIV